MMLLDFWARVLVALEIARERRGYASYQALVAAVAGAGQQQVLN